MTRSSSLVSLLVRVSTMADKQPKATVVQVQQVQAAKPKPARQDDNQRVDRLLRDVSRSKGGVEYTMDTSARKLIVAYAAEMACTILEEMCVVAKHRNSKKAEAADVNLVLAKKFGIELPGYPRIKKLHKQNYKMNGVALSKAERGDRPFAGMDGADRRVDLSDVLSSGGGSEGGASKKRKLEE